MEEGRKRLTDVAGTRLNRPAVDDDGGAVVSDGSHEAPRHVFVAAWDGDVTVVVLGHDHRLDRVCDNITTGKTGEGVSYNSGEDGRGGAYEYRIPSVPMVMASLNG